MYTKCVIIKDLKNAEISGIGGANMLQNGLKKSFVDIKELSVMGIFEVLKKALKINKIIKIESFTLNIITFIYTFQFYTFHIE